MSYVDAFLDRDRDIIKVVERVDGQRVHKEYPAKYTFYYQDPRGKYTSIYGDKLTRVQVNTGKKFNAEKKIHAHKKLFESDINPVFRCLADNYLEKEAPKLNVCFFDIEVDFNKDKGFADPEDPFNPVTAIALHLGWLQKTICIAIKPQAMSKEEAETICNKFEDTFLMETEAELLTTFLDLIDDADVLSGWNSEGFDIPYMVNRITRVLSKSHTRKFCLWDRMPRERTLVKFGKDTQAYELAGRIHLDYLELYRKFTYHEMHSYSLDAIGEYELQERKVAYEGTLDQLYNNDFETFISYNRQDVDLLVRLDQKLAFIDLANVLSHANTVLLVNALGAVAQTDMAIVNEAHSRGYIVPDKPHNSEKPLPAAGAYVATPVKGMHKWIGSVDLNSLYPSILRACNMSPETIIGQVRHTLTGPMIESFNNGRDGYVARAWEGKFATEEYELVMAKDTDTLLTVDFTNGDSIQATGAEIYDLIFNSGETWLITANATIFRYDQQGIVSGLLERWYAERKELQAKARESRDDPSAFEFWDKRQLVKKINLNSLYGALLNPGSRFFDERLGQSTTLTGRCIARHMASELNRVIAGEYDHTGKAIVYGDTDSTYFSAYPVLKDSIDSGDIKWDKDTIIEYYDAVGEEVNKTFPDFMHNAFHTTHNLGKIIATGREVVGEAGIFITKKRYAILVYDLEGKREDKDGKPGKIKAMGLDLKRSDTPDYMQKFLEELLMMVLTGSEEREVIDRIIEFRKEFRDKPSWHKGTPKRVNNLTNHTKTFEKTGKCSIGHVMAAINWNRLRKMNSDAYSMEITDGMKTIVCKLKDNPLQLKSIGYPTDENRIPEWFKVLPFDDQAMEDAIISKKVDNLLGELGWNLDLAQAKTTFNDLFEF